MIWASLTLSFHSRGRYDHAYHVSDEKDRQKIKALHHKVHRLHTWAETANELMDIEPTETKW